MRAVSCAQRHSGVDGRRVLFGSALICAFTVLTACATSAPTARGAHHYLSAAAASAEYRAAERTLTLAPSWTWPSEPELARGPNGHPVHYEVGAATNDAQTYWFCTWARLLTRPDAEAQDRSRATRMVSHVLQLHLYRVGFQNADRRWFGEVVSSAVHGDLRMIDEYASSNCPLRPAG